MLALLLHLELTACLDVSLAEVERLVRIELDAQLVTESDGEVPHASIHCDGPSARLTYQDATRTIDLARIDSRARPRLLALALAELAAPRDTSWAPSPQETPAIPVPAAARPPPPAAARPPPPAAAPPPPPAPAAPPPAATATVSTAAANPPRGPPPPPPSPPPPAAVNSTPASDLRFAASILGSFSIFTAGGTPLFGGRAAVELAPSAFGARLDLTAEFGSERSDDGLISILSVSSGLSGFGRVDLAPVSLDLGAGLRAGLARIRGTPRDPTQLAGATVTGAWTGPFAAVRASGRAGPILLAAEVEAGLVIRPVIGRAGDALVAADGAWIGARIGVGL